MPGRGPWRCWARCAAPAEESTFRRAFALVSADVLDRVLGAWLWTRAVRAGGRLVIAIDGKTVRGARNKTGKAPHLVAALAHGIGAVLGQVAVDEKSNEIPAVRELLKAFTDLAGVVFTTMTAGPGLGSPDLGLLHRRKCCHLAVPAGLRLARAHDRPPGARRKHRAAQGTGNYI
jgi:hypothetical protein